MRTRLLTDLERNLIQKYLAGKDKSATVRSIARYARQINFQEINKDIDLIKAFMAAYAKRVSGKEN